MTDLRKLKKEWLKDPKVAAAYKELIPEYEIARMLLSERLKANMTQKEIAKKMKTTQSVIARLESGGQKPSLSTIEKYARALGKKIDIRFKKQA